MSTTGKKDAWLKVRIEAWKKMLFLKSLSQGDTASSYITRYIDALIEARRPEEFKEMSNKKEQ